MALLMFVIRRMFRAILTLLLVVTFAFVFLRLAGDPLLVLLPENTDAAVVEIFRARWGLDRPLPVQYAYYLLNVLQGDFGQLYSDGRSALDVVLMAVPKTLQLGGAALAIAILIGIPAGTIAAVYRNSIVDRSLMMLAVIGHSMPTFFVAILAILLFSLTLRWLPSSGSATWLHLLMPAMTLGFWLAASIARITRSAVLDVLVRPYMRTARAKGIPLFRRVVTHALPNAAIPIVTIVGMIAGHMVAGAVIVETVFAWPGIGRLTVTSVGARELAVVQTIVLLVSAAMVTINLLVDISYAALDPRIREARS